MEKDYSLLRPFDLEAAKRGEKICNSFNGEETTFVAEAGPDGDLAVRDWKGNIQPQPTVCTSMLPLAWIEGKPVYKGDVLYHPTGPAKVTEDGIMWSCGVHQLVPYAFQETLLTWRKPITKVKKSGWINIYKGSGACMYRYDTKEQAERADYANKRVDTIQITWEQEE